MKNMTMQQIADELGVSRLTVSSVINGNAAERRISEATVRRVQEYMDQRGYVPSRQAVRLKTGKKDAVGILYCDYLYSHLIDAFNQINGIFHDAPGAVENMIVARPHLVNGVRELLARGVSQLVWIHTVGARTELADPAIHNYLARFDSVVMYNFRFGPGDNARELLDKGYHLVGVDRLAGFAELAAFLKGLGHRTVALPDTAVDSSLDNDHRGIALEREGITAVPTLPEDIKGADPDTAADRMVRGLIDAVRSRGVTAAVAYDDEQAGRMLNRLVDQGIRVPEEITVTGYDNMPFSGMLRVPLTTLGVPTGAMVRCLGNILRQGSKRKRHCFGMELVKRQSHGRVRGN